MNDIVNMLFLGVVGIFFLLAFSRIKEIVERLRYQDDRLQEMRDQLAEILSEVYWLRVEKDRKTEGGL